MKIMLKVKHRGEAKYCAKVFPLRGKDVALHEAHGGKQVHEGFNSPGGIDRCLLLWLQKNNVETFYFYDHHARELYKASVDIILKEGINDGGGGRNRYYLPYPMWTTKEGVIPFETPYIKAEHTLEEERGPLFAEPKQDKKSESVEEQLGLF